MPIPPAPRQVAAAGTQKDYIILRHLFRADAHAGYGTTAHENMRVLRLPVSDLWLFSDQEPTSW
jgi:hypothetical protein